jgi:hypothetical protein
MSLLSNPRLRLGGPVAAAALLVAVNALPASAAPADQPAAPGQVPTGDSSQVTTLVGVHPSPAVQPGGPPPAGALPPVPDRFKEPIGPFSMFMEVLASAEPSQFGELATPGCVTDSVYKRGMKVVFRFELYDMDNKVRLTTADGTKAQVMLPDGTTLPALFLPRGDPSQPIGDAPWTWVTTWHIPPDYPLGSVMYTVDVATPDGRSQTLQPASIPGQPVVPGVPLAIAGTLPTIIP